MDLLLQVEEGDTVCINSQMDQPNPNNNPDNSGDTPLKRKRGRPRKYPRPDGDGNAHIRNVQNVNQNPVSGGNAGVPSGFDRVNGNQPHRRDLENDSNDPMVGQVVSCVIEAVFDAGYLLSAKVGNFGTTLRGLVFKPGHYDPISAENDVAPSVPMIRRNKVPFPSGTSSQIQNPHRKERKKHVNIHRYETQTMKGSPSVSQMSGGTVSSSNLVASQGKDVASMADQTANLLSRGSVVPVTLQPVNQSSEVMTQAYVESGSTSVTKGTAANGKQPPFSQIQTGQNVLPRGLQDEGGPCNQLSAVVLQELEAKSIRLPSLPSEKLNQDPSEFIDTESDNCKSGDKILVKDSGNTQEEKVNDVGQPLLIKPLQAVQAGPQEHSVASVLRPSGISETGKITDPSQENNTIENQASKAEEPDSGLKLEAAREPETEVDGK